ncbi:hypothetical protein C8F01DRAFT_1254045 [Mycena amicta]|nr:hypothetical protein C8F01DRAFT_1254045 [Mycena amicta]
MRPSDLTSTAQLLVIIGYPATSTDIGGMSRQPMALPNSASAPSNCGPPLQRHLCISAGRHPALDLTEQSPIRVLVSPLPPPPSSAPTPHLWLLTDFACRSSMQTVLARRTDLYWTGKTWAEVQAMTSTSEDACCRNVSGPSAGRHSSFRFAGPTTASACPYPSHCYINPALL